MKIILSFLFATSCIMSTPKMPFKTTFNAAMNEEISLSPQEALNKYGPVSIPRYPENKSFMSYYFGYLDNNYGANTHGTCGFIALEMLFSYYDIIWNDNLVPDSYESDKAIVTTHNDVRDAYESPGAKDEYENIKNLPELSHLGSDVDKWKAIANYGYSEYWNYMNTYKDSYLHLQLLSYHFPQNPAFLAPLYWDLNGNIGSYMGDIIASAGKYVDEKTIFKADSLNIQTLNGTFGSLKNQMRTLIQSGTPLLVTADNRNHSSAHAFIIYDYDETEDEFYCHTGWRFENPYPYNNRMPLSKYEYSLVNGIMFFEPTLPFKKSNRYINFDDDSSFSPYDSLKPRHLKISHNLFLDELPEFKWECMADSKLLSMYNTHYEAYICDSDKPDKNIIMTIQNINDNKYRFTAFQYNKLLSEIDNDYFWFILVFSSDTSDEFFYLKVKMPTTFSKKNQIRPIDWSSTWDRGLVSVPNDNIIRANQTINGMTLATTRKRVWRDGTWLVVQPKDIIGNKAYLQMEFDKPVYALTYSLALRNLSENCGEITVDFKNADGTWESGLITNSLPSVQGIRPLRTLVYDIDHNFFSYSLKPMYGIRITNLCKKVGGKTLSGALCIDDFVFSTEQSLPMNWNINYKKSCFPNNIPANGNNSTILPKDPIGTGTR